MTDKPSQQTKPVPQSEPKPAPKPIVRDEDKTHTRGDDNK